MRVLCYSCTVMLTAEGPLGPSSRSNDTATPSCSESSPAACTADMCMNTSRSSVAMNPKPFWPLNHFTRPDLLIVIYSFLLLFVLWGGILWGGSLLVLVLYSLLLLNFTYNIIAHSADKATTTATRRGQRYRPQCSWAITGLVEQRFRYHSSSRIGICVL